MASFAIQLIVVIVLLVLGIAFRNRRNTPLPVGNIERSHGRNSTRWTYYSLAMYFAICVLGLCIDRPELPLTRFVVGSFVITSWFGFLFVWWSCFFIEIHEGEVFVRTMFGARSVAFSDIKRVREDWRGGRGNSPSTTAYDEGGNQLLRFSSDTEDYWNMQPRFIAKLEDGVVVECYGLLWSTQRKSRRVIRRYKKSATPELELNPTHEHFYDR